MYRLLSILATTVLLLGQNAHAEASKSSKEDPVTNAVATVIPKAKIDLQHESTLPGFNEVIIDGQLMFVSNDGRYVILGAVLDLDKPKENWELGISSIQKYRNTKLDDLKHLLIYKPQGQVKATIRVFTDIDCGVCRKFHQDIPRLNELGIQVEYISFPRFGLRSASANKANNVWCSDDANKAMDNAAAGKEIKESSCDITLDKHYLAGREVSIVGTPTIVFSNGNMAAGYIGPEELAKMAVENSNGEQK